MLRLRFGIAFLVLGGMLAFFGWQEWQLSSSASATPQDMTVPALLARGPDGNPHVRLHDYVLGEQWEYWQTDDSNQWDTVYIPAFPQGGEHSAGAAKVIVVTGHARTEEQLAAFRARGTLTGVVKTAADLDEDQKKLMLADYPATDFSKSVIFQEGRQPMETGTLVLMLGGGVGLVLLGGVLLLSGFVRTQ
jgi:hypothetical protein